jgi:hypothetical protein
MPVPRRVLTQAKPAMRAYQLVLVARAVAFRIVVPAPFVTFPLATIAVARIAVANVTGFPRCAPDSISRFVAVTATTTATPALPFPSVSPSIIWAPAKRVVAFPMVANVRKVSSASIEAPTAAYARKAARAKPSCVAARKTGIPSVVAMGRPTVISAGWFQHGNSGPATANAQAATKAARPAVRRGNRWYVRKPISATAQSTPVRSLRKARAVTVFSARVPATVY